MRQVFELSEDQHEFILKACKPKDGRDGPDIDQVNRAWDLLGKHMGFDGRTCEPEFGLGDRFFTAEMSDGQSGH